MVAKLVGALRHAESCQETLQIQLQEQMTKCHKAEDEARAALVGASVAHTTDLQLHEAQEENERLQQELLVMRGKLAWERGSVAALHKVINESLAKHMAVD